MLAEERMKTVWFLYQKLVDCQYNGEFEEFGYYLNAIIPLARSVTQGIQKEHKHKGGFDEWYSPIQKMMGEDEHFKFFNQNRNLILKKGMNPPRDAKFEVRAFYDGDIKFKPQIMIKREGSKISGRLVHPKYKEKEIPGEVKIIYKYYFEDKPHPQALIIVNQYLRKLEDLVIDSHNKYS